MQRRVGEVVIERHQPDLPRFVILPFDPAATWGATALFAADGSLGEVPFRRRSIHPWGDGRWFMGVTDPMCREGGFDTGNRVTLTLAPTPDAPPAELAERLQADPSFAEAWACFSPSHHREWSRWVEEAKKPETRARRADQIVAQAEAKAGRRD